MIETWQLTIPELTGDRLRKAYVYLPSAYANDEERRFPVMYMFDGQNLFSDEEATYGKSWGLSDYLDYTDTPLIVAAVECDTQGNGRLSEYSPVNFTMPDGEKIKGRGRVYMNWLVNAFKPFVDERFRTLPDRENTAVGGSSMGGLMALYAAANYNRVFSKAAALSPSLWVEGEGVPSFIEKGRYAKNTRIYMDYGSKEWKNHSSQKSAFGAAYTALVEKNVFVTARVVPFGTHCEASWEEQIPIFMNVLGFEPDH